MEMLFPEVLSCSFLWNILLLVHSAGLSELVSTQQTEHPPLPVSKERPPEGDKPRHSVASQLSVVNETFVLSQHLLYF